MNIFAELQLEIDQCRTALADRRSGSTDRRATPRPESTDRRSMYDRTRDLIINNSKYGGTWQEQAIIIDGQLEALKKVAVPGNCWTSILEHKPA